MPPDNSAAPPGPERSEAPGGATEGIHRDNHFGGSHTTGTTHVEDIAPGYANGQVAT